MAAVKKFPCPDGNAPWKIDSPEERELAEKADTGAYWRKKYAEYYAENDPEYYRKGLEIIRKTIRNFRGEVSDAAISEYTEDIVYSLHRFGCSFDEYFIYDFEHLNTAGRDAYITDKMRWEYYNRLNLRENLDIFNNKMLAYETFRPFYRREVILVEGEKDRAAFGDFVSRQPSFIMKPYNGSGGVGIRILSRSDYPDTDSLFAAVTQSGTVVCEELIRQDDTMASLHPKSANTVRFPTVRVGDTVHLFHPYLRIGCGNEIVDNCAKNRLVAPIDPETGILFTNGIDKESHTHVRHPDTGVVIPGFQIPRWDEAIALVTKLAKVVKGNHYCGWDMALSKEGWMMVEGNPRGELAAVQYTIGRGVKQEIETFIKMIESEAR